MGIKVDTSGLDRFAEKLKNASKSVQHDVVDKSLNTLAADVLARTIKQTPRDTSNLARSWAVSNGITQKGNTYSKTIYNPVEYGVYVEYGHRTVNHRGWVPGKFMLTRAIEDVDKRKDQIVTEVINKYFGDLFK